jgi:putative tryptophan/tyrosine transport system substrate-binding protein
MTTTQQAERLRLPAVYAFNFFVRSGGLISYGVDQLEQAQKTAVFVIRILRGEKPADLPAEGPNKFEMFVNTKTAKAMGLTVPPTLLARADEIIE